MSGVRLTRHYFKGMLERRRGPRRVRLQRVRILIPPEMAHYGFSKTVQSSCRATPPKLTKATSVTVNAVLPGPTWVEMAPVRLAARAKGMGTTVDDLKTRTFTERRPASWLQRYAEAGGDRQSDLLRLLESLQRHQRRHAARRRRHRDELPF